MFGTVKVEDLAMTLSLEEFVNLMNGQFFGIPAKGIFDGDGIQFELGPLIVTGAVVNYAVLINHITWGLGDPCSAEGSAFLEEFIVQFGGTAKLTFSSPDGSTWCSYILDGKYVDGEDYLKATEAKREEVSC